jgi:hypothetical protein
MQQQSSSPSLEALTKTLDYTFIDLPELVDGKHVLYSGGVPRTTPLCQPT